MAPGKGWRLLSFGRVSEYKDYDGLADALAALPRNSFRSLTIAGKKAESFQLPAEDLGKSVELNLTLRFIEDFEVPAFFAEADFIVLPYKAGLTSGVAALAMGFGVPIIAPKLGGMAEVVPELNLPLLYDPAHAVGLRSALNIASQLTAPEYARLRDACREAGDRIHPHRVSEMLLHVLQTRGIISV
jgi:beta-1,4-mannosyltransferase